MDILKIKRANELANDWEYISQQIEGLENVIKFNNSFSLEIKGNNFSKENIGCSFRFKKEEVNSVCQPIMEALKTIKNEIEEEIKTL